MKLIKRNRGSWKIYEKSRRIIEDLRENSGGRTKEGKIKKEDFQLTGNVEICPQVYVVSFFTFTDVFDCGNVEWSWDSWEFAFQTQEINLKN